MATSRVIEFESGTTKRAHPHNGYYAGDFSRCTGEVGDVTTWSSGTYLRSQEEL